MALHAESTEAFLTTDYVVDETLTLFKARGNYQQAFKLGTKLFRGELAHLIHVSSEDVNSAWDVFNSHRDKAWSFTDCTSYVVMKRLKINEAFAFDRHFAQFGFVTIRP
jgi:predicted nucleic acid-binding protein